MPALLVLTDLLKRGTSLTNCSCLGGDEGTGTSAKIARVTLENLIAGGGSSSESLSLTSNRFNAEASGLNPSCRWRTDIGELRRICGRVGCATAAMMRFATQLARRRSPAPRWLVGCSRC